VTVFVYPSSSRQGADWQPAVDIYRISWGWILKIELAGVRLDDVQVRVNQRSIVISGARRDWVLEGCSYYSMEISYSRFQRTVELPDDLTTAKIRLDYRDGILFVRIKVKEEEEDNE
jgi:HSP20 family protein